jgi:protein O-GlcNAc transferase
MCASNFQDSDDKLIESQKIKEAIIFLQSGQLVLAKIFLAEVTSHNPNNDEAFHLLGLVFFQQNQLTQSFDSISRAIAINPKNTLYYSNRGEVLRQMGKPKLAIEDLDFAISRDPKNPTLFFNRGVIYHQLKDYTPALDNYLTAIQLGAKNFQVYFYLGNIYAELAEYSKANNAYEESLKLNPQNASTWTNLGFIKDKEQKSDAAVECYRKSIALNPGRPEVYSNLGKSLCELKKYEESILACSRAIEIDPTLAAAYSNMADTFTRLKNYHKAYEFYEKAIKLDPEYEQAFFNYAGAFYQATDFQSAILCLDSAIRINPLNADAYYNRSIAKIKMKDSLSSLEDLEKALKLEPKLDFAMGDLLISYLKLGIWDKFEELRKNLPDKIKNHERVSHPLRLMSVFDSLDYLKSLAVLYIDARFKSESTFNNWPPQNPKIRIAYFSEDLREHPVGYLLAEVLELHNRSQFEVHVFSFSKDKPDQLSNRIKHAVDFYHDVSLKTNEEIVHLARSLNLDIAIDLGIFTADQLEVFKERLAPIQVNYLAYAGTSGSQFMDYIIADEYTIPQSAETYYTEKIVRLPCFMPRDTQVKPSAKKFTRTECGLPNEGFVFCCISGYGKILPEIFASWMNILKQVPGSCLWLADSPDPGVTDKIRFHAEKQGVSAKRLVFAKRLDSPADYLSRLSLADLFLDTFPYGAHTIGNDALWAGVPVLTRVGETFASRVAGSFLMRLQLPELITNNMEQYQAQAVSIGNNPTLAARLRQRLMENSTKSEIFNSLYYTKKLEESYKAMCQLVLNAKEPKNILIKP